jgi:hypothetical protein
VIVLAGLVTACHGSDGDSTSTFLAVGVNDIGGAMRFTVDGGLVVGQLYERGVDQNADGDGIDFLLRIVDLASGRETLVPDVALGGGPAAQEGVVPFLVPEIGALRDLNGDGDVVDNVLFVRDARGRITSLGLATEGFVQSGALVAFAISEASQNEDLDGDGELASLLGCVYDADQIELIELRIPVIQDGARVAGHTIVWLVDEQRAGDLDGDGDELDHVVFLYDADIGVLRNTGHAAVELLATGSVLALLEPEPADRDLNGNGNPEDFFVDVCDLDTGAFRPTDAEAAELIAVGGDLAVFDLYNGGDVTWVYDRFTDTLLPLSVAPESPVDTRAMSDRRFAFLVHRFQAGGPLGGEMVLHLFDARTGVAESTERVAYSPPQLDEHHVAFLGLSSPPLEQPPTHTSVRVRNLGTGVELDTGLLATDFRLLDERIVALVKESWVGADLDGDEDQLDSVVEVYDLRTGLTFHTGLAADRFDFESVAIDGEVLVMNLGARLKAVRMR